MRVLVAELSHFFLTLPQDEMESRARMLNRITRLLMLGVIGWAVFSFAASRLTAVDLNTQVSILLVIASTAAITFYCQARREYQTASLIFILGFSLAVSIAVWEFGRSVPEVHLLYFLPIALAATLWGSAPGSAVALGIWGANVLAVALQPGSTMFPPSLNEVIGLATLSIAYVVLAQVVGRYAENLVQALGRAEQKALEAQQAEDQTRAYADELENAYVQTVFALAKAVEAKDTYTADHAERLADRAEGVAKKLGITNPDDLRVLRFGAMLHDVGKIGVPDSILKKPGPLTADEWKVMRQHPVIGCRILETVARLRGAAQVVRHHHERWDGKGYPDNLTGETIPLNARILTVVDSYSAIVDARVYKPARSHGEAISELVKGKGSQFDPQVVQAFLEISERDETSGLPTPRIIIPAFDLSRM